MKKHNLLSSSDTLKINWLLLVILSFFPTSQMLASDTKDNAVSDDQELIERFCQSKGPAVITFDASNIKQFWVNNNVVSEKEGINVFLLEGGANNTRETPFLPFQLMNVNEVQDCEVSVIADQTEYTFSIYDNNKKQLCKSSDESDFLQYKVKSATLHLEDTARLFFYLKFSSPLPQKILIKKIILSFHRNPSSSFFESPNKRTLSADNFKIFGGGKLEQTQDANDNQKSFIATGKRITLFSNQNILVPKANAAVSNSVTIKNIGQQPAKVYVGYAPYTQDRKQISFLNTPYKKNTITTVVSFNENDNRIIIDKMPEWKKGCRLAFNAKEDLSDFPNFDYTDASIVEVNRIDENKVEIVFDKPIHRSIPVGTKVRIQSPPGYAYIYTNQKTLQPGEEASFTSELEYDENLFEFSLKAFSKGTYYVTPILLSISVDSKEDNSILVTDYSFSF